MVVVEVVAAAAAPGTSPGVARVLPSPPPHCRLPGPGPEGRWLPPDKRQGIRGLAGRGRSRDGRFCTWPGLASATTSPLSTLAARGLARQASIPARAAVAPSRDPLTTRAKRIEPWAGREVGACGPLAPRDTK